MIHSHLPRGSQLTGRTSAQLYRKARQELTRAMKFRLLSVSMLALLMVPVACKKTEPTTTASAKPSLGINPYGTSGVKPDMSKVPPELKKVFDYIDTHTDQDAENLQKWIQQPSISNSGEGIPESAEMVKGFFDKLGCQR
jgi:hypothetical protein